MGYKNVLIHRTEYVLGAWHKAILWQSLLTWLNASDEIRVCTFDMRLICSEYGFNITCEEINLCVYDWFSVYQFRIWTEMWLANRDEIIFLQLDMQLTGIQITLSTWVRPTDVVRILALEVQLLLSVYELHTRLALSNEIRVYRTDF